LIHTTIEKVGFGLADGCHINTREPIDGVCRVRLPNSRANRCTIFTVNQALRAGKLFLEALVVALALYQRQQADIFRRASVRLLARVEC